MRFSEFMRKMMTSQSGISSKRMCGFLGWVSCIVWISYYVFTKRDIPGIVEIFIMSTVALLGLDTIPKSISSFNRGKCNDCPKKDDCKVPKENNGDV